jgi:sugar transferase (PEP-CTERM/EpsH1 system associated)
VRILWVKSGGLLPLNHGGRIRSYHLARELAKLHEVSLFTFSARAEDPIAAHEPLKNVFRNLVCLPIDVPSARGARESLHYVRNLLSTKPYSASKYCQPWVARELSKHLEREQYDLLLCDFLLTAAVVPWNWKGPKILFTHNIEAVIWERHYRVNKNPLWKAISYREYRMLERMERNYVSTADHVLAVSENDRDFFRKYAHDSRISVIPTGVDTEYFAPDWGTEESESIVFTGSMDWMANEDGIVFFIEKILPLVRRQVPKAKLWIVGRRPSAKLKAIAARETGIVVTGTVEDIRPYMHRGSVYVVPLLVGGGTRIKIFEAMAAGKAVVSTTIGAEGLPVSHGENILLADDPASFANSIIDLISDPARRRKLGQAARELVASSYSWHAVGKTLGGVLQTALERARPAPESNQELASVAN